MPKLTMIAPEEFWPEADKIVLDLGLILFVERDEHYDHTPGEWHCYADSAACYPV